MSFVALEEHGLVWENNNPVDVIRVEDYKSIKNVQQEVCVTGDMDLK